MTINELYKQTLSGDIKAEKQLFESLYDRFRAYAHLKVWNTEDAEEIVQNALTIISAKYKDIEITTSFAAWAHKVIENKFLAFIQTKQRQKNRTVSLEESNNPGIKTFSSNPILKLKLLDCLKKVGLANRRYARILNLHYQGFYREEVCKKLEMTREQSYVVMSRARSSLKECLENGEVSK